MSTTSRPRSSPLLDASIEGFTASQKRKVTVDHFKTFIDSNLTLKPIADLLYATNCTVSKYFPKTASVKVPTGLSRRRGQALLARLAATANWPGVTLGDARRRQIRREVEAELFESGTRVLDRPLDLEAGEDRGKKRGRANDALPPLKRARSF